ncbi:MAG TPA: class I SAM-dependent methyltransferase [Nitrospirota bacterium]|nr:class I SAM-dependent methyltransferase [Nitrospirota bacterium]
MTKTADECLTGNYLYGDDFGEQDILKWFRDEENAYYQLTVDSQSKHRCEFHALNYHYGYRYLKNMRFTHVLGVGSSFGDELIPVCGQSEHITILEPANGFSTGEVSHVPVKYVKPLPSGDLPFEDSKFDLITCFSVLHHISNVSKVSGEFFRCLKPGGYALVREPVVSMGDWRVPRHGLTRRERGIPQRILRDIFVASGFRVLKERKCCFSITSRLHHFTRGPVYNNSVIVRLDELMCALPVWRTTYHAQHWYKKLQPTAAFFVLQKA